MAKGTVLLVRKEHAKVDDVIEEGGQLTESENLFLYY